MLQNAGKCVIKALISLKYASFKTYKNRLVLILNWDQPIYFCLLQRVFRKLAECYLFYQINFISGLVPCC